MKNLFLIYFLIIGFWSFGQDCGCQEEIRTFDFGKSIELENPKDYESDTIYISAEKLESNPDFYFVYLINRSDSIFQDCAKEGRRRNSIFMIEAIDSFGNWKNIRHFNNFNCSNNRQFYYKLDKNSYLIGGTRYKSNQGNFKTQVRFRLDFENHQFYSEPFTDSIQYCSFINCYYLLNDYLQGKSSNYDYLLFQRKKDATIKNLLEDELYLSMLLSDLNEQKGKEEKLYQLLKFHDVKFKYYSRLEQGVFENRLRTDSTCLAIYGDTLRRYIPFWYSLDMQEKTLERQIEEGENLYEINRTQKNIEKLRQYLPNRNNILTPNNKRYFIKIDDEYFIKVECLENSLVKVGLKPD